MVNKDVYIKIAQNNRFHAVVRIAWHLQLLARQCTSTVIARWLSF